MAAQQGGGMENPSAETAAADPTQPPSAVIAPSSVTTQNAGAAVVRHKELAPSAVDTGKDTQCLVEEDDSEC